MGILGVSSATRKFHNDMNLGATIALAYVVVIFCRVVAPCAAVSRLFPEKSATFYFTRISPERHVLILETKMECRTGHLRDESAGRKGVWTVLNARQYQEGNPDTS